MLQSKAIKESEPKEDTWRDKLYGWWVETAVSKWYYDFTWKYFGNPWFQIKRLWQWYWNVFHFDYDFDFFCMFSIMEYKLKRIERVLFNGHAHQESKDMKALKLAIKLAGRLKEDKYEEVGHDRIEKKWGKTITTFKKLPGGNSQMNSRRSKAKGEKQQAQAWLDTLEEYRLADIRMKRDERWMYAILHKYGRNWWD